MERFFVEVTPWDYVWATIISVLFVLSVFFLVGQLINLIDRYNRTAPIKYEQNGKSFTVPQHVFVQLPASVTRDMFKQFAKPVEKEEVVLEEEVGAISLPVIRDGHVLVVGETGAGKTTAMRAIIKDRKNVVVLDPHNDLKTWNNAKVIGTGRDFNAIQEYLSTMQSELEKRYALRGQGKNSFEPLTVVTDEMPAIVAEIGKDFGIVWRQWIREGRKIGLFIIMGSQSTRVETIGIRGEGDLLENFNHIITLGKQAQTTYKDLVDGMDRPAVIHSVDGIFPVNIPYIPPIQNVRVIQDIESEWGTITKEQVEKILAMKQGGESNRSIEQAAFGYTGGHAYSMVKLALEKHGAT